ncbi:hypothetical protein C5167_005570 [Papaver somniferum]|uniref:Serine aminopeptidase S33 domain-containing protein n=1 Tax=Papaver somniferum TaxID=3469 RepID=A0A4Y7JE44_PAPSO|nr:hypothetical protein C5167_005570 [Papaver somniferum]
MACTKFSTSAWILGLRVASSSVSCRRRRYISYAMAPRIEIDGIDDELSRIINSNLDHVSARRRSREVFKDIQLGIDHCLFKLYEVNARGIEIFSKSWLPQTSPVKAILCFCHGYGDTCTFFFEGIARKLASFGYGVYAMDYPGFGLSEGLHGYISSFDGLVDDVIEHYSKIKESMESQNVPSFLFGQSMGGAVALKVHLKQPNAWSGAVLVAPMCKIAEDMVPPLLVKQLLIAVTNVLPKSKLVPEKDIGEMAFRDLEKRKLAKYNVIAYRDKPRLRTALELLRTTDEIERRLEEVSLPILILHGEGDIVTDPSVSKALYEKAKSSDKKLHLIKNASHSLLEGEPDDSILEVFNEIICWLDELTINKT